MGLSKHAREEVDDRLKQLYLAFAAGVKWHANGVSMPEDLFIGFSLWVEREHNDLFEYVEQPLAKVWYEELRVQRQI